MGPRCEQRVVACSNSSCANGAECIDGGTHFRCHCPTGWTGFSCRENINECAEIPRQTGRTLCKNGAGCRDYPGSYLCLCPTGWEGRHCEVAAEQTKDESQPCDGEVQCSLLSLPMNVTDTRINKHRNFTEQFVIIFIIFGVLIPFIIVTVIIVLWMLISNVRKRLKPKMHMPFSSNAKVCLERPVHHQEHATNKHPPSVYNKQNSRQIQLSSGGHSYVPLKHGIITTSNNKLISLHLCEKCEGTVGATCSVFPRRLSQRTQTEHQLRSINVIADERCHHCSNIYDSTFCSLTTDQYCNCHVSFSQQKPNCWNQLPPTEEDTVFRCNSFRSESGTPPPSYQQVVLSKKFSAL